MVNHSGRNTEDNTNSFTKTEKKGGNRGERNKISIRSSIVQGPLFHRQ
jgi:hypothetical protein